MGRESQLEEVLRRLIDANLKYYQGLGQLVTDYVGALSRVSQDLGSVLVARSAAGRASGLPGAGGPPARAAAGEQPQSLPVQSGVPALVLEGPANALVQGMFRVDNGLPREVAAPVAATPFMDESGAEVHFDLASEPKVVALKAGESALVRLGVTIPEAIPDGATCRGEVTVPGLSHMAIPVVIRRQDHLAASPENAGAVVKTPPDRRPPGGKGLRTKTKSRSKPKSTSRQRKA